MITFNADNLWLSASQTLQPVHGKKDSSGANQPARLDLKSRDWLPVFPAPREQPKVCRGFNSIDLQIWASVQQ
jgi:hypothetical protein